jgi:hypothetical protein
LGLEILCLRYLGNELNYSESTKQDDNKIWKVLKRFMKEFSMNTYGTSLKVKEGMFHIRIPITEEKILSQKRIVLR